MHAQCSLFLSKFLQEKDFRTLSLSNVADDGLSRSAVFHASHHLGVCQL